MFAWTTALLLCVTVYAVVSLAKTGGYAVLLVVPLVPVIVGLATQAGYGAKLVRVIDAPGDDAAIERTLTGVVVCDFIVATTLALGLATMVLGG